MGDKSGKYKGNKGLEYYRAYPRDFFEGVVGMPGPLRGFYRMVLDIIYMHDGFLLQDFQHISGLTGYGPTQCKRMLSTLVHDGKIHIWTENPEYFTNKRAVSELKTSRKFQENQRNKAIERWDNKDLAVISASSSALPNDMPPQDHKTTRHKRPADSSIHPDPEQLELTPDEPPVPDVYAQAFDFFQVMARRANLPVPAKLSDTRKAKLKARLKDCGGLEGWQIACAKVEASEFCTGKTGWVADLDFMLQESSFNKIMEGSYDNRTHNNGRTSVGAGMAAGTSPAEIADRGAAVARRQQAQRGADPAARKGQPQD